MTSRSETGDRGRQPPRDCLGGAGHRAPCCRWRSKVESAPCSYRRTSTGMYCTSTRHECVASGLWSAVVCREKLHVTQEISGACLGHCGTKVKHTVTTSCSDALLIVYSSRKPGGLPAGAGGGASRRRFPFVYTATTAAPAAHSRRRAPTRNSLREFPGGRMRSPRVVKYYQVLSILPQALHLSYCRVWNAPFLGKIIYEYAA